MSIWMLLIFAVNCLLAVLAFGPHQEVKSLSFVLFAVTLFVFLIGVLSRGIRRPVT
jgi:formate-dependent nitrite reductase membrane component NrfD